MKPASSTHFWTMSPELFHGRIPFPLTSIIEELKNRNAETVQGIFRLEGSERSVRTLIDELDQGEVVDWTKYSDIHTLTTALRAYFRSMAEMEPLIPPDCFDAFLAIQNLKDESQEVEIAKTFLCEVMPPIRRRILMYLLDFVRMIAEKSSLNLMDIGMLSGSIGPSIVATNKGTPGAAAMQAARVVEFLVTNFQAVFPDYHIDSSWFCTSQEIEEAKAPPLNVANVELQILRANTRKNHLIPYVPPCQYSQDPVYKRPTRPPPPRPGNSKDVVLNMFDSLIQRVSTQSSVIEMLIGARARLMGMNPEDLQRLLNQERLWKSHPGAGIPPPPSKR